MEAWLAEITDAAMPLIEPLLNVNPVWFPVQAAVMIVAWLLALGLTRAQARRQAAHRRQ